MQTKDLPIGFFDSGVGGVSVLAHAVHQLPGESFLYYGDTKNAPYGSRTEEEIKALSLECGAFLYQKGVKAIVMACNTATSISVRLLRKRYNIPVISIEPAVKPANEASRSGHILVMATPATLSQGRYRSLIDRLGCGERVINLPCEGLAGMLEDGDFEKPEIRAYLHERFIPFRMQVISGIVLGCTHYSLIADTIRAVACEVLTGECRIFDGMYGMVRHLGHVLEETGLRNPGGEGAVKFYSSGGGDSIRILKKTYQYAYKKF